MTDPAAGQPVEGKVSFALPAGAFRVSLYSPTTGLYSPALTLEGGRTVTIDLLPFEQDVVLRATRLR